MNQITFSYNWNNKLNCKAFTTIRIQNPKKYRVGGRYEIIRMSNGKPVENFGNAQIQHIINFNILEISEPVCLLDSGYNKKEFLKIIGRMYPEVNFCHTKFSLIVLAYMNKKAQP